jgi:F-type H+-transporting ATPase subunit delta
MSGLETIARRYAQALFELGVETGALQSLVDQTEAMARAYVESDELRAVIDNPLVAEGPREAVLGEIASRLGVGDLVKNTVRLLCVRRRMSLLPYVARELALRSDQRAGILRAQVLSAQPLAEDYVQRLQQQLEKMSGRNVIVDRQVDPALIGGVVTRLGDMVIDGSVRSRLSDLRDRLHST